MLKKSHYLKYSKKMQQTNFEEQSFSSNQQQNLINSFDATYCPQKFETGNVVDLQNSVQGPIPLCESSSNAPLACNSRTRKAQTAEGADRGRKGTRKPEVRNEYRNQKMLPHISEEFHYKITNSLLASKIQNPKRDKFIHQSFQKQNCNRSAGQKSQSIRRNSTKSFVVCSQANSQQTENRSSETKEKFYTNPVGPTYLRNKTATNKKFSAMKTTTFGDLNSSCKNYNDAYTISLENERMGRRIFHARSMVEEYLNSTYFTFHLYNGSMATKAKFSNKDKKKKEGYNRLNSGLKVFFNKKSEKENRLYLSTQSPTLSNINFGDVKGFEMTNSQHIEDNKQQSYSQAGSTEVSNGFLKRVATLQKQGCTQKIPVKRQIRFTDIPPQNNCLEEKGEELRSEKTGGASRSMHASALKKEKIKCPLDNQSKTPYQLRKILGFNAEPDKNLSKLLSHNIQTFNPNSSTVYGKGSTILQILKLQVITNPFLKDGDLIMIEFYVNSNNICTEPMAYRDLKSTGVKLAFNSKSTEFIPMKIWKFNGIQSVEVGIIDLNVRAFNKKNEILYFQQCQGQGKLQSNSSSIEVVKEQKISSSGKTEERNVVRYVIDQKLRKSKCHESESTVKMQMIIYSRKFSAKNSLESEKEKICFQKEQN